MKESPEIRKGIVQYSSVDTVDVLLDAHICTALRCTALYISVLCGCVLLPLGHIYNYKTYIGDGL